MWIYSSFFSVKFFSLCGRGDGRHNPFTWFYNNYHCLYTSQVLSTSFSPQGESCVGDITAPPTSKKPHNNKTTNNISCNNNNNTPKGDCETSLSSESDLWQQIDLHFFTSYIASAIINEHDKLVQVFPNLINVCRKFRPNRTLINRWMISGVLWTIVHSLHRSLNLRFFFIAYIFIFLFVFMFDSWIVYIFHMCIYKDWYMICNICIIL